MANNRRKQSNFICNPDLPWGPVYDTTLHDEGCFMNYEFIDEQSDLVPQNYEVIRTILHLKEIFTQFKDVKN